jgi:hypothetical protein
MQETKKILILFFAYVITTFFVWFFFTFSLLSNHLAPYIILLVVYYFIPIIITIHFSRLHFLRVVRYVKENHPEYFKENGFDDLLYENKSISKWKSYMLLEFTQPDELFNKMKRQDYYYAALISFQIIFSLYLALYLINKLNLPNT